MIVAASLEQIVAETMEEAAIQAGKEEPTTFGAKQRAELPDAELPDAESDAGAEAGARRRKHRESTRSW